MESTRGLYADPASVWPKWVVADPTQSGPTETLFSFLKPDVCLVRHDGNARRHQSDNLEPLSKTYLSHLREDIEAHQVHHEKVRGLRNCKLLKFNVFASWHGPLNRRSTHMEVFS